MFFTGWSQFHDKEDFADTYLKCILKRFAVPLANVGVTCSVASLLEEWRDVFRFTLRRFLPSTKSPRMTWYLVFTAEELVRCSNLLTVSELLFTLPASASVVERGHSTLARVKPDGRSRLGRNPSESLVRISAESQPTELFNPQPAINRWMQKPRRLNQLRRDRPTQMRQAEVMLSSDSDEDDLGF